MFSSYFILILVFLYNLGNYLVSKTAAPNKFANISGRKLPAIQDDACSVSK